MQRGGYNLGQFRVSALLSCINIGRPSSRNRPAGPYSAVLSG